MLSKKQISQQIKNGTKLSLATTNYPSRGQTALQILYQTKTGKLFFKKTSVQNHTDCQVKIESGSLAEREYWAYCLAHHLGLQVPELWLMDSMTTVQRWIDHPDGRQYATSQGKLFLTTKNIFECALFDWLTGQVDRHDANYLYDLPHQEIILIDSAHSFLKYSGSLPDYLRYFEIGSPHELRKLVSTSLMEKLKKLKPETLSKLVPLRNADEAKALFQRLQQLQHVKTVQNILDLYRKGGA